MKKEFNKALKCIFDEFLTKSKGFSQIKSDKKWSVPSELIWKKEIGKTLWVFIAIIPKHNGGESFTIEALWSKLSRYPQLNSRPSLNHMATPEKYCDEFCLRIGELGNFSHQDKWYEIEPVLYASSPEEYLKHLMKQTEPISDEIAFEKVRPVALNVFEDIENFVFPYFEKL